MARAPTATTAAMTLVAYATAVTRRKRGCKGSRVPRPNRSRTAASHPANHNELMTSSRFRVIYRRASVRMLKRRHARMTTKKNPTSERNTAPVANGVKCPTRDRFVAIVSKGSGSR